MTLNSRAVGVALAMTVAGTMPVAGQDTDIPRGVTQLAQEGMFDCDGGPVAVVARFLHLSPDQVQAFTQLLRQRQETIGPLLVEIARREERIRELIATGGSPAEIGILVIQIHRLRQQVEAAQAQFLAAFGSLLDEEQRRRWEQVRMAARLQPVLPAFQALQML